MPRSRDPLTDSQAGVQLELGIAGRILDPPARESIVAIALQRR